MRKKFITSALFGTFVRKVAMPDFMNCSGRRNDSFVALENPYILKNVKKFFKRFVQILQLTITVWF